ncbi:MAG: GNAT family N-acetyltransferase [Chloroflexota bacterium]|nr:GNAT family N-acetyltransferase [Chloroflexota bacterium]
MTSLEIAQVVESAEALSMQDAYNALAAYRPEMGASVEVIDGAVCGLLKTVPSPFFNRVLKLGIDQPASEGTVDRIRELFERHDLPFAIQLSPFARPDTLKGWLAERGFVATTNWVKLYRDVTTPPQIKTELRIVQAGPSDRDLYGRVAAQGYGAPDMLRPWFEAPMGRPGWTHYLAYDGDIAVSGAAMFVQGNCAALFGAATVESHRGRGAQGALMVRRIRDAAELGCRWVVTETGEETEEEKNPSLHNMVRTGFQIAYTRPNFRIV